MSFNTKLIQLLKADARFVSEEGELVIAAVHDSAWQIDKALVKLLLSDKVIAAKFFEEIEGHWIFNINIFIDYISNKNFLDNSYTRFRNRIGLVIGDNYLSERGNVALVWPYKDCVLEGGQTKEEDKRKEIFFNEVLAQDEINRLLSPKVFHNFMRFTSKGKEALKNIVRDEKGTILENMIIKGNNLLALNSLKSQYRASFKCVYIDPPYNTGSDSFGYNDSFSRSTWLTFMKNRIESAKCLLAPSGIFLVQCSFHHFAHLRLLMDDIFEKHLCDFHFQVRHPDRALTGDKEFNDVIEYLLIYSNDPNKKMPFLEEKKTVNDYCLEIKLKNGAAPQSVKCGDKIVEAFTPDKYEVASIEPSIKGLKKISIRGSIREKNSSGRFFVKYLEKLKHFPPNTLFKVADIGDDGIGYRYFYSAPEGNKNGGYYQGMPMSSDVTRKQYANFYNFEKEYNNVAAQGDVSFRNGKKPEELLMFLLNMFTSPNDLVLDYHLGCGTTAAVCHKLKRTYVGIEQMDHQSNLIIKRLNNVIKGDETGISGLENVQWEGGGAFIYCEMMDYNEAFIGRIQESKTSKELVKIWEDMSEKSFLNWYVNPRMPEDAVKDFEAIGVEQNGIDKQKRLLIELLDKNQLYVNLSEIDDERYKVSKEVKAFNRQFYGEAYNG